MAQHEDSPRGIKSRHFEGGRRSFAQPRARYSIYCPACGALNYLDKAQDLRKERCAECGSPLCLPAYPALTARREIAYPVLAAVLTALTWILFFSGPGRPYRSQQGLKFALPGKSSAPAVQSIKKFPLPTPPALPVSPQAAPSRPQSAPPPAAAAPIPAKPAFAVPVAPREAPAASRRTDGKPAQPAPGPHSKGQSTGIDKLLEIPLPNSAGGGG